MLVSSSTIPTSLNCTNALSMAYLVRYGLLNGHWWCRAMGDIKGLSSTGIYAWTTLISCFICVPGALIFEGPKLKAGIDVALQKNPNFYWMLLSVGLLYHLYNQVRHSPDTRTAILPP